MIEKQQQQQKHAHTRTYARNYQNSSMSHAMYHHAQEEAERLRHQDIQNQLQTVAVLEAQIQAADEELYRLQQSCIIPPISSGTDADSTRGLIDMSGVSTGSAVSRTKALERRTKEFEINARDIPAEDALDTIVRLENRLKLETRRNDLRAKEKEALKQALIERRKTLKRADDRFQAAQRVTGWDGKSVKPEDGRQKQSQIEEMERLERQLEQEHKAAEVIMRKKTALIQHLTKDLEKKKEDEERLRVLYNDVRVKERDIAEQERELRLMAKEDQARNRALDNVENDVDTYALSSVSDDNMFLKNELKAARDKKKEQEQVIRAQVERTEQLAERLKVIGASIRSLGLESRFSQTMASSLVAASGSALQEGAPDDMSRIFPKRETLPVATYELLHRDLEAMRAAVSRKDIMVLEKEAVVECLEQSLAEHGHRLQIATLQQIQTKADKVNEMQKLHATLASRHKEYRKEIDHRLNENLQLKSEVTRGARKSAPAPHYHDTHSTGRS